MLEMGQDKLMELMASSNTEETESQSNDACQPTSEDVTIKEELVWEDAEEMTEEGIQTKIDRQTEQFYIHSQNTRYRNRVRQAITDPQFIGLSASNLL